MRFAIKIEAMNGSEIVLNMLDALLTRAEEAIHELEIVDADLLENSAWYDSCRMTRRTMLEKSAGAMLHQTPRTRGPHLRRIYVNDEKTASYARKIAHTPLSVLVENSESDGALVKSALRVFATQAAWDLCFGSGARQRPTAFSIESRGGHGELEKLLAKRLEEAAVLGLEPRLIVIADSDGEWPGDIKKHVTKIRGKCLAASVPCPPLNKRTAENYIPDAVWKAWAAERQYKSARPAVEALLRLSYQQRDHLKFDTPTKDPWDSSKTEVNRLFADVSTADQELLRTANLKGSGPNSIATILETHETALTRAEFQIRDQAGELESMVQCIEDEL